MKIISQRFCEEENKFVFTISSSEVNNRVKNFTADEISQDPSLLQLFSKEDILTINLFLDET
jgi:hypothetical protein